MSDSDYQYEPPYGQQGDSGQFDEAYRSALEPFWAAQKQEISQASTDISEYKSQQLPLARIKKIMKSDEDVRMISAEAPVLFAKACELFILDLTLRGWVHAEDSRRRTLQRSDIASSIAHWEVLDFLSDIIPLDEGKPDGTGTPAAAAAAAAAAADGAGPSSSTAAAAAAAAAVVPSDLAAVPPVMYYNHSAGLPQYQQAVMPVAGGMAAAVPDLQQAAAVVSPGPVGPLVEPPVAAVMFEQWANEGQAAAAAAAAAQGDQQ